jgi:hypothetical protein
MLVYQFNIPALLTNIHIYIIYITNKMKNNNLFKITLIGALTSKPYAFTARS